MFSKKSILSTAIMLYDDYTLDEEDVLAMFQELTRKNTTYPYWKYDRIEHQLNDISTGEFKTEFRFNLSEIDLLQDALQIPERFICDNGTVASGTEGLLLLLKRFAYPCRLSDIGTVRPISRPGENQRVMYNGLKRVHGIKFQSIATPDGMIANLFGPVEGRRHDASMLRMSGVLEQLPIYSLSTPGAPLCIYGDPAYPLRVHQDAFNKSMSSVRVAVEWVFGDIINFFTFLDFKRNLKIGLSPIGKMYSVCALLRNAYTCLYGSNTSTFFDLTSPTIHEYFQF